MQYTRRKMGYEALEGNSVIDNVIEFKNKRQGFDIPMDGEPWLKTIEIGSCILIKDKTTANFNLGQCWVLGRSDKGFIRLLFNLNGREETWVDANRFCSRYDLGEVLCTKEDIHSPST